MKAGVRHTGLGDEPAMEGEPGYTHDPRGAFSPAEKKARRDERARNARDRREFEAGEQADDAKRVAVRQRQLKRARKTSTRTARAISSGSSLTGMDLLVGSLLLVGLYVALSAAQTIPPFLGGFAKAFRWLADPNATIGYGAAAKPAAAPAAPGAGAQPTAAMTAANSYGFAPDGSQPATQRFPTGGGARF